MPEIAIERLPEKLPVIIMNDGVLFPPVEASIPFRLPPELAQKIRDSKAVILGTDTSKKDDEIFLNRFGLVAGITEGPLANGQKDIYLLRVAGMFRCKIKNVTAILEDSARPPDSGSPKSKAPNDGTEHAEFLAGDKDDMQFEANWERVDDGAPLSEEEWSNEATQKKIRRLNDAFNRVLVNHARLEPELPATNAGHFYGKSLAYFAHPDRLTLGTALDRLGLLVNFSVIMPESISPDAPARKKIVQAMLELLETPGVLERIEAATALMKTFAKFLESEVTRLTSELEEEGGGGMKGENPAKELMSRFKEREQNIPAHISKVLKRELKRFASMNPQAGEYEMLRAYLDWLLRIPWGKTTQDTDDLNQVERILNEDHWGLAEIKERIMEYLAARKLNPKMKAPILGFYGPPGVGKTSLGESIARGLGRTFHRMSVGGIKDESEIRGHRRTYVGALPGRIIQGLAKCESENPVFMIDEADKLERGNEGNPASALLEVLDPQQNNSFVDHYIGEEIDLSKVFFIVTVNYLEMVPPALRDRIEWIPFYSYTEDEKVHIAKQFLIPREIRENGLSPEQFVERNQPALTIAFSDSALRALVSEYVVEAGVRNLERLIAKILRKVVSRIAKNGSSRQPDQERYDGQEDGRWEVTEQNLRFYITESDKQIDKAKLKFNLKPGVVPMLAVGPGGGQVLYIETAIRKKSVGKRKVKVTGLDPHREQVGNMMEESIDTAWDYLACEGGLLEGKFPENMYLRVHCANGAIPKDGPSAGVPFLWALYSIGTDQPIKPGLVATGEITLAMGEVLAVGGIKEKILGAAQAGAKEVIIPASVVHELNDIPQEVKDRIRIIPCSSMLETLKLAFPNDEGLQARTE